MGRVVGCEGISHRLGQIFIVVRTWSPIGRVLIGYCWSKCGQREIIGRRTMSPRENFIDSVVARNITRRS